MSEHLLAFLLGQCSNFPNAEFWEIELRAQFGDGVDRLVTARMLQPLATIPGQSTFPCRTKRACEAAGRELVATGGKLWAVCNCPASEPPHEVSRNDLQRYRLGIEVLAESIAKKNGLSGRAKQLDARLWYLGDSHVEGHSIGWVLGLLRDDAESVSLLEALLTHLPSSYQNIVVLSAPISIPPQVTVRLNGLGVFVRPIPTDSNLKLATEELAGLTARRTGDVATWPDEFFKDEDGTWLTARILSDRFSIPDSRLKEWRERGCPDLNNQRLSAKKVSSIGWVYFRTHVNQIANRRDDKGKVEAKLDMEARLESASRLKKEQSATPKRNNSR